MSRKPSSSAPRAPKTPPTWLTYTIAPACDVDAATSLGSPYYAWHGSAYQMLPAMSRAELAQELDRLDEELGLAVEWMETVSRDLQSAALTSPGFEAIRDVRDLVRLRAMLPRVRFWLGFGGMQGSSTHPGRDPVKIEREAAALAELVMRTDGKTWCDAACLRERLSCEQPDVPWGRMEIDAREEFEGRLRELFRLCLTRSPLHAPAPAAAAGQAPPTPAGSPASDRSAALPALLLPAEG